MRTVLFLWMAISVANCQDMVRDFEQRQAQEKDRYALQLWVHLDQWIRAAHGCPLHGDFELSECKSSRVVMNTKEFTMASKMAERLFGLSKKKKSIQK